MEIGLDIESDEIDGDDGLDDVQGDETVDDTKSGFQNEGGVRVDDDDDDDEVKVQVQNEGVRLDDDDDDDKVEDMFKRKVIKWMILELKWMDMILILLLVSMVMTLGDFDIKVLQFHRHFIFWLFKLNSFF